MNSPLHRLYQTKLTLLAVILTVAGVALLVGSYSAEELARWSWLTSVPAVEFGAALFTTGLIVVAFEYLDREDAERRAMQRFRKVLNEQAPAIRDAVVKGFAFSPDSLTNVASPATLDKIVRNTLAIQLGDRQLAEDAYADLKEQVIRSPERARDTDVSVALAPWEGGPASGKGSMFVATIRWEYRVVPHQPVLRFACTSDLDEYREQLHDPSNAYTWYFEPVAGLDAASKEVFELVEFAADGRQLPARHTTRARSQMYSVNIGVEAIAAGHEVAMSFTYRVLVQRHSHLSHLDIGMPTKGLKIHFAYGECGIRHVNMLEYIVSPSRPWITRLPASDPSPHVEVAHDGWVFPKAGVAFVWVLEGEVAGTDDFVMITEPAGSQTALPQVTRPTHPPTNWKTPDRAEYDSLNSTLPRRLALPLAS